MHFAICLWGIVRSLRYTIDSIQQYCLDPIINGGHTYEIFMHTYRFTGAYVNNRSKEIGVQLNFSEWNVITPDHIYVEDQDLFDELVNYPQVEKESKYRTIDGVVFLRPDATYLNELPYYLLEHFPQTLFLPDFHRSCHGGEYNDRMAMGDLKSAITYGKRFEHALAYSQQKQLHSETFTYDYLTEHNVKVKEIPFRFRRMRASGELHDRDASAVIAPRDQKAEQEYTTAITLRIVYMLLEEITNHRVYIWNHDDHENQYCKPHPYISFEECLAYRKKSKRLRLKRDMERQGLIWAEEEPETTNSYLPQLPGPETSSPFGAEQPENTLIVRVERGHSSDLRGAKTPPVSAHARRHDRPQGDRAQRAGLRVSPPVDVDAGANRPRHPRAGRAGRGSRQRSASPQDGPHNAGVSSSTAAPPPRLERGMPATEAGGVRGMGTRELDVAHGDGGVEGKNSDGKSNGEGVAGATGQRPRLRTRKTKRLT